MTYHILNGDALKAQFPADKLTGEIIVARECMIDGPVKADSLQSLFEIRSAFISGEYGEGEYKEKTIPELSKIIELNEGDVHLWFEEDLFCQTNLWFVCSLLYQKEVNVTLVLPQSSLALGFGGLSKDKLVDAFENRKALTSIQVNQFALLWFAYRNADIERLLKLGVQVHADFPFVMRAIEAHFDRLPNEEAPTKPEQTIIDIIKEKGTSDFGTVFREFHNRLPIYGFGDLQVKRIYDQVIPKIS